MDIQIYVSHCLIDVDAVCHLQEQQVFVPQCSKVVVVTDVRFHKSLCWKTSVISCFVCGHDVAGGPSFGCCCLHWYGNWAEICLAIYLVITMEAALMSIFFSGWSSSGAWFLGSAQKAIVFFSARKSPRCSCKDPWCVAEGGNGCWLRGFGVRVYIGRRVHIMAGWTEIWEWKVQALWHFVRASDGLPW